LGSGIAIALSFATGVAFGFLGSATTPLGMLAVPVFAFWIAAVLARPIWAIPLFFAAIPFALERVSAGTFEIVDLAALLAAAAVLLARMLRRRTPRPALPVPWVLGWGVAFCAIAAISATSALDKTIASDQLLVLLASFLLACAVVAACETLGDLRVLAVGLMIVGCVVAVEGFANTTDVTNFGAVVQTRSVGPFQSPNELGSAAAMLLVFGLGILLSRLPKAYRVLGAATALLSTLALILSLSRGAWLGAVGGVMALAVFSPRARKALVVTGLVAGVIALLLGALNADPTQVQTLQSRFTQVLNPSTNPYDERPAIWAEAEREILARPVFGYGPGNFPVASERSGSEAVTVGATHAHDVLLTVAAEMGVPAALVLIAFTLGVAASAWRAKRRLTGVPDLGILAGLSGALVAYVVHGLVDFTLRNSSLMALLWVLAAMVIACDRVSRTREPRGAIAGARQRPLGVGDRPTPATADLPAAPGPSRGRPS
jgi:putative inorganic carbon (HCO3(-)) transporter